MTWIITTPPHPLDEVWSNAIKALSDADEAMERLGEDATDNQLNAVGDVRSDTITEILALPSRNVSDCLFKLECCGVAEGHLINDCDPAAIMDEAKDLLDAAIAKGCGLIRAGAAA
ncbi:hypothetical protein ACKU27_13645 [Sphingobium yanoikuyae]|uniref:hypothetical protein n=1 Tax=Sphingobium yanoikuyae TaxID=13690 RepID=UPI003B914D91